MRIISQDGTIDVPYENVVVYQDIKDIMCIFGGIYIGRKFAQYSTETKAQKAMEMLREFYTCCDYNNRAFQFPKDEDLEV